MRKTKIILTVLLLVGTVFGVVFAVSSTKAPASRDIITKKSARLVKTQHVHSIMAQKSQLFPGKTRAPRETNLAFRVGGQIFDFPITVGQFVKQGEIIAKLDDRDYKNEFAMNEAVVKEVKAKLKAMLKGAREEDLRILEAELKSVQSRMHEAKKEFDRKQNLFAKKVISANEFEDTSARFEIAEATVESIKQRLRKAKAGARPEDIEGMKAKIERLLTQFENTKNRLKDTVLKAPYDCYIAEKHVENFDSVEDKQTIVTILDCRQLDVVARVPEEVIANKKNITKVECEFEVLPGKFYKADIREVGCQPVSESQTYLFTVRLKEKSQKIGIWPGMSANLKLYMRTGAEEHYQVVPAESVVGIDSQSCVWVFDDKENCVNKTIVNVAGVCNNGLKVTGLKARDEIVVAGAKFLSDKQQVKRYINQSIRTE